MRTEIEALMRERILRDLARRIDASAVAAAASRVILKELDPYDAAELLLAGPEGARITSYNVCYTKLLRITRR